MKQNHKLTLSFIYRKQRTWTTVRRQNFRWGRKWSYRFAYWIGWYGWFWWIVWNGALIFRCSWNYIQVLLYNCRTSSIYTCTNTEQWRSGYSSASQQSSGQQSAVNCWTQHVNKYVQMSSSTSGRCHTEWALCLIYAGVNCWFVGWSKYTVWISL